jgi:hypothetical protein
MLKLPRNIIFKQESDAHGNVARAYFYSDEDAKLDADYDIDVTDKDGNLITSTWSIPHEYYIKSNCEILMEEPSFLDLFDRKANYYYFFISMKTQETADALSNFMKSIYDAMISALRFADKLYWKNKQARIRSEYSLEYCLLKGVNNAASQLRLSEIINDIQQPNKLLKEHVEEQFEDMVDDIKKDNGDYVNKALIEDAKKKMKKTKKPRKKTIKIQK